MDRVEKLAIIYLTGFMGAGKSQVGKRLAQLLNMDFIDTDEQIESEEGMPIRNIFESKGEAYFREKEKKLLKSLTQKKSVISTGGGIILDKHNRELMKKHGTVIFLYCSPLVTIERLKNDHTRPLLDGKTLEGVRKLLEQRLPLYLDNDITINTSMKPPENITDEIAASLYRRYQIGQE